MTELIRSRCGGDQLCRAYIASRRMRAWRSMACSGSAVATMVACARACSGPWLGTRRCCSQCGRKGAQLGTTGHPTTSRHTKTHGGALRYVYGATHRLNRFFALRKSLVYKGVQRRVERKLALAEGPWADWPDRNCTLADLQLKRLGMTGVQIAHRPQGRAKLEAAVGCHRPPAPRAGVPAWLA